MKTARHWCDSYHWNMQTLGELQFQIEAIQADARESLQRELDEAKTRTEHNRQSAELARYVLGEVQRERDELVAQNAVLREALEFQQQHAPNYPDRIAIAKVLALTPPDALAQLRRELRRGVWSEALRLAIKTRDGFAVEGPKYAANCVVNAILAASEKETP